MKSWSEWAGNLLGSSDGAAAVDAEQAWRDYDRSNAALLDQRQTSMRMSALARQDAYQQDSDDPWQRAAATRRRTGLRQPDERPPSGLSGEWLLPQTPLDYGTNAVFYPLPPQVRGAALAMGALFEPSEAVARVRNVVGAAAKTLKGGAAAAEGGGARGMGALFEPKEAQGAYNVLPGVITRANPTPADINTILEKAREFGRKGWPTAEREVFKTTPEAYAETMQLVPQVSIRDRLPGPLPGEKLPLNERALPIVQNTEQIANRIANRLEPLVATDSPLLKFYHTGPVIRGLGGYADMSLDEANAFMRRWAGQGAATSPRTQTPPNLRNSSYLMYEAARNDPLTPARFAAEGNRPGFPMMGMHVDLADMFRTGTENLWRNPKPGTFRENWSGNLRDVTGDTHNIRATLYEFDQANPGKLPRGWFTSDDAYAKYRKQGFGALDPGAIEDRLEGRTVNKVFRQSEYLPMTQPWYRASELMGVHPAEAQSGGWFSYGPITGLQSPPKTITNLLNDQIDATAKALNVPAEKVVEWWGQGKIPLAGIAGTMGLGGIARQDQYQP